MARRVDITPGLFTDFAIGQSGRWTPALVRLLPAYSGVAAGLIALRDPDLEADFLLLRRLLAEPDSTELRRRVRDAGPWFESVVNRIAAGEPLTRCELRGPRTLVSGLAYAYLLRHEDDRVVYRYRDLVGLTGKDPTNIRMARKDARKVPLDANAEALGAACARALALPLRQTVNDKIERLRRRAKNNVISMMPRPKP